MEYFNFIVNYFNADRPLIYAGHVGEPLMRRFIAREKTTVTATNGSTVEETAVLEKGDFFECFLDAPGAVIRHMNIAISDGDILVS